MFAGLCVCVFLWGHWCGQGDGGPPCLHCAGDLWPFVTLSEWEERDAESEKERF